MPAITLQCVGQEELGEAHEVHDCLAAEELPDAVGGDDQERVAAVKDGCADLRVPNHADLLRDCARGGGIELLDYSHWISGAFMELMRSEWQLIGRACGCTPNISTDGAR